ncbi:MAG: tripartite tricarboxylate transporter substrate binding protein [Ideonella sp.]|nr:tripartite tricarboxylate transporter substrate binding protein [Ideonella sp.]MBP8100333.1 tripartite tricarboxylate transporter substrate binding protein [Burkholderiaceae bacterium]
MKRVLFSLLLALTAQAAVAQSFPTKPLRLVVPYPAGGATDLMARVIAQKLSESFKQQVVVDNKPGAGGNIGVSFVARAPADGYTIGISATNSFAINPHLTKTLPYDALKDLTQLSMVGIIPNVIVVGADVPAKTIAELVALAKKQPLAFASPGQGTSLHLAGEMLNDAAGISMTHVPYKGDVPALQDVIGGRVPVMTSNLSSVLPHLRSGKLRALAVTTAKRAAQLPEVPTMAEAGYKDFDISVWFTLFTATGVPRDVQELLNREIVLALNAPDVRQRLQDVNIEPSPTSLEQIRGFTLAEYERWGRIVKKTGVTWD